MSTWEKFKTNELHISSPSFSCVACVDKKDQKRVVCMYAEGFILFNCYGDYKNEAKRAFEDIVSIHSSIK